jgi:hypothetical protein
VNGRLYAAGGGVSSHNLAAWNGDGWETVGGGINGAVVGLLADGPRLWAGGAFSMAGDVPSYGIALWDSVSATNDEAPVLISVGVPNPFISSAEFSYELTTGGPVSITVNDAAGRHVATIESDVRPPGVHSVRWDGRGEGGRRLPAGMYFVHIVRPDGRSATRKAVLLH